MATFAKSTFSAASYAAFRPTYPPSLYTTILSYHRGPPNTLLDLGCGHGLISRSLSPSFTHVTATDPSSSMITQAIASTPKPTNITYQVASAENIPADDGQFDMVVSGQAAHWFDYSKAWKEFGRVVRGGGTLAFWGYKDHVFVDFPKATEVLGRYCYGWDGGMEQYWEQPGRNILRGLLRDVVPPEEEWMDVRREEYEPRSETGTGKRLMWGRYKLGDLVGYGRTFSAFHNWQKAHPERTSREKGGPGDLIDEMFDEMIEAEPEWKKEGDKWMEKVVEIEWGSYILLARKK